jgi:hypothetical protein
MLMNSLFPILNFTKFCHIGLKAIMNMKKIYWGQKSLEMTN